MQAYQGHRFTFIFTCMPLWNPFLHSSTDFQSFCVDDVGNTAAFLSSPLASAVTGSLIYVDNGLHSMGLAVDSPTVSKAAAPTPEKTNVAA